MLRDVPQSGFGARALPPQNHARIITAARRFHTARVIARNEQHDDSSAPPLHSEQILERERLPFRAVAVVLAQARRLRDRFVMDTLRLLQFIERCGVDLSGFFSAHTLYSPHMESLRKDRDLVRSLPLLGSAAMEHAQKTQFPPGFVPSSAAEEDVPSFDPDHGAKGLQRDLGDRLKPDVDEPANRGSPDQITPPRSYRTVRRVLKIAAGLTIVAVFGWLPLKAIWQTSSVEAVVNARLVTLRSPIDGEVSSKSGRSTASSAVNEGGLILGVVNARGDRNRLDDLRRQMSRLGHERPSLAAKFASAAVQTTKFTDTAEKNFCS